MSNELSIVQEQGQSMADLIGINMNASQSGPSVARLNVNQDPIEAMVEFNGKQLKDEVIPKGAYKLTIGDETVYSSTASIRVFAIRNQYQRWNGETKEMEKTVLAKNLNSDLMDNQGGFNLGRPSGYVKDFNALDNATKEIMRSAKSVKVFFGLITLDNPMDVSGQALDKEYVELPFVFDVKNAKSKKAIDECIKAMARNNTLPTQQTIKLSPGVDKIPTGATYGHVVAALGDRVEMTKADDDVMRNFLEFIEYINGSIIDKHHERNKESVSDEDKAIVASIIEMDDE